MGGQPLGGIAGLRLILHDGSAVRTIYNWLKLSIGVEEHLDLTLQPRKDVRVVLPRSEHSSRLLGSASVSEQARAAFKNCFGHSGTRLDHQILR